MLLSFETPLCMLGESIEYNDYHFGLVHLFEGKNGEEYKTFLKEMLANDKIVILDCSTYELGEAFNIEKYSGYINELGSVNPHKFYYILPDVFNDCDKTVEMCQQFPKRKELKGKRLAVVQGHDVHERIKCLEKLLECDIDIIGIPSFNFWTGKQLNDADGISATLNELERIKFAKFVHDKYKIKVHILGCQSPEAFYIYNLVHGLDFIYSMDTCSPIAWGVSGVKFGDFGISGKCKVKYEDYFRESKHKIKSKKRLHNILSNIEWFQFALQSEFDDCRSTTAELKLHK